MCSCYSIVGWRIDSKFNIRGNNNSNNNNRNRNKYKTKKILINTNTTNRYSCSHPYNSTVM